MKKNFFILGILALAILTLSSCDGKVDDTEKNISVTPSSISMHYDEVKQLTVNVSSDEMKDLKFTYKSENENVATVTAEGLVKGVAIGSTTITVKSSDNAHSATVQVTITPRYTLFKEPYMVWNSSIATVKAQETRSLTSETTTRLMYSGENSDVTTVVYNFDALGLDGAVVQLSSAIEAESIMIFLKERYKYVGLSGDLETFTNRLTGDEIGMKVTADKGTVIGYAPVSVD